MGVGVVGPAGGKRLHARGVEFHAQRGDDIFRNVRLDCEDIAFRPIVARRPLLKPAPSVDQLGRYSDHPRCPAHASRQDVTDTEAARRAGRILVAHCLGRDPSCNVQSRQPRKGTSQFLGDAVGEIVLARIAAQIREWQDRDAVRALCHARPQELPSPRGRDDCHNSSASDECGSPRYATNRLRREARHRLACDQRSRGIPDLAIPRVGRISFPATE